MLTYVQHNLASYPFRLVSPHLWNDLRLIGKVITDNPDIPKSAEAGWMNGVFPIYGTCFDGFRV